MKPGTRKCVICGNPFTPKRGSNGSLSPRETCNQQCETQYRKTRMIISRNQQAVNKIAKTFCRLYGVTHPYKATMPHFKLNDYHPGRTKPPPNYRDDRINWDAMMVWCSMLNELGRQPQEKETPDRD